MTAPAQFIEPPDSPIELLERSDAPAEDCGVLRSVPIPIGRLEWLLLLIVTAGRCAFSLQHSIFRLYPDEPGTLAMARWLSGSGGWDMWTSLTWKPGMATLIAPLFWLTDDQESILHLGLGLAALAGGMAAVMLSRLIRRLTRLAPRPTLVIAALLALSPSALTSSAYVWGEALVTVTFLGTLAALLGFYDAPSIRAALATILWAASGYLSHSRLLPLLITVGLLLAGRLIVGGDWYKALVAFIAMVVSILAIDVYSGLFYSALWDDPDDANTVAEVAGRLGDPLGIVFAATGQLWYLLVSTAGVFGLGVCVLVSRVVKRADRNDRRDAWLLMTATLPLIGLSVVFMTGRERIDQQIYGRYNDAVVWPIVGLGVAWILGATGPSAWREGKQRLVLFGAIALAMVETMMVTHLVLQRRSVSHVLVPQMIPNIAGLMRDPDHLSVVLVTLIALCALGAIALGTRHLSGHRQAALAVVTVVWLALAIRTYAILEVGDDFARDSTVVRELIGPVLDHGDQVVYGLVPEELDPGVELYLQGYYSQFYQWYLPEIDITVIASGEYPADGYAFAPIYDRVLTQRGSCIIWKDPVVGIVLWDTRPSRCEPGGMSRLATP